jgi:hypothetical protein
MKQIAARFAFFVAAWDVAVFYGNDQQRGHIVRVTAAESGSEKLEFCIESCGEPLHLNHAWHCMQTRVDRTTVDLAKRSNWP